MLLPSRNSFVTYFLFACKILLFQRCLIIFATTPSPNPTFPPSPNPTFPPSPKPTFPPTPKSTFPPTPKPTYSITVAPSRVPTASPSFRPSNPTSQPSEQPTRQPLRKPSSQPNRKPSTQPSKQPFRRPTIIPSNQPSCQPSLSPSKQPSKKPSRQPTLQPTNKPSSQPRVRPSKVPSMLPSSQPTSQPNKRPSRAPSRQPIGFPTLQPNSRPSKQPYMQPSRQPVKNPSSQPTNKPSFQPRLFPTLQPFKKPSMIPSVQPFHMPTSQPNHQPTQQPRNKPTRIPSLQPFIKPSSRPSIQPYSFPSNQPLRYPTKQPSACPSVQPLQNPSSAPSRQPVKIPSTAPSSLPTIQPSIQPTSRPFRSPTKQPTFQPVHRPTRQPSSDQPTSQPTINPTSSHPTGGSTSQPTIKPSSQPSQQPIRKPSKKPSTEPSVQPTEQPFTPTKQPSIFPSYVPTYQPSLSPSLQPTRYPSCQPSKQPRRSPSQQPDHFPTIQPSCQPLKSPTSQPKLAPSLLPTFQPIDHPTVVPSSQPYFKPTCLPTSQPSSSPTYQPSLMPSLLPSSQPQSKPSSIPFSVPSALPSQKPTIQPSSIPSDVPSYFPTYQPSRCPSMQPSTKPSTFPSGQPIFFPTSKPSIIPTKLPSLQPANRPTINPSVKPSDIPSLIPSLLPTYQPVLDPSTQPRSRPSFKPSMQPMKHPSSQPLQQPSGIPSQQPIKFPTINPTIQPSKFPSQQPNQNPSLIPSEIPSSPAKRPTMQPTTQPNMKPSKFPSSKPSFQPTLMPFDEPSSLPSTYPTYQSTNSPSSEPSLFPSKQPNEHPSLEPSSMPSGKPSLLPTLNPTISPVITPSRIPSKTPTNLPTLIPSKNPTQQPSSQPSFQPSLQPRKMPSNQPSKQPARKPSRQPTKQPSKQPIFIPSVKPSCSPSHKPTRKPIFRPTYQPTFYPSHRPSVQPKVVPSEQPFSEPSRRPTFQDVINPSNQPSPRPNNIPSRQPLKAPSKQPSKQPSKLPSSQPSQNPFGIPSIQPTVLPNSVPSFSPTGIPTYIPSFLPSVCPTLLPSSFPSRVPLSSPSTSPSCIPSNSPTQLPTLQGTQNPSSNPSSLPSVQPYFFPTLFPSLSPSRIPTFQPFISPTCQPHSHPSQQPKRRPSNQPTKQPSHKPSTQPSRKPSRQPSRQPRFRPSIQPSCQPKDFPSSQPRLLPSKIPSLRPTRDPSTQPSRFPRNIPTNQPEKAPSRQPNPRPRSIPSRQPIARPSCQPSVFPTSPSSHPSKQPYHFPSAQPLSHPTQDPHHRPSVSPLTRPTKQPTNQPTSQPSCIPLTTTPTTSNPIWAKYVRSCRPSIKPSYLPSSQPSSDPSTMPTRSIGSEWLSGQQMFHSHLLNSASAATTLAYFGELLIDGRIVNGGNQQFHSYSFGDVKNKLNTYDEVLSIQLANFSTPSDYLNSSTVRCSEKIPLLHIVSRLTNFSATSSLTTVVCNKVPWVINNCGTLHSMKLCTHCLDPCAQDSEATISYGCAMFGSCFHALIVSFHELSPVYPISSMSSTERTTTSITVLVKLKYFVHVFCMTTLTIDSIPTVEYILSSGYTQSGNQNLTFSFTSLQSASNYSIFCVTQSKSGALIKDKDVRLTSLATSTRCCKTLSVKINHNAILRNYYYSDVISFSVDALPSQWISVDVVPIFGVTSNSSNRFCVFTPLPVNIYNLQTSGSIFSIGVKCSMAAMLGMLSFRISLSGSSKDQYHVQYLDDYQISIVKSGYIGRAPEFSTAILSSSGIEITLNFTVSTNRAQLEENFQCSKLLRFESVESAACRWVDNSTILISLSAFSALDVANFISVSNLPDSVETVLKLIEQCPAGLNCKFWPTISIYDRVIIMAPRFPVVPLVVISAPAVVSKHNSFKIDLRSSIGNAGRKWLNGSFRAEFAGSSTVNISLVKYQITSQLFRYNYSVVNFPPATFQSNRIYSLTFILCNWLNACGRATFFLTVIDSLVPTPEILILGSPYRYIQSFQPLNLFAEIRYSSPTTSTYWQISQYNVAVNKFSNECNRSLQFHLTANTLTPGQEYQISFTVIDAIRQASSSAIVTVFVEKMIAEDIVAIISQGDELAIGSGQSFTLDAARSYNRAFVKDSGSPVDGLLFSWSCQVIGYITNGQTCPLMFSSSETDLNTLIVSSTKSSSVDVWDMYVTLLVRKNDLQSLARIRIFLHPRSSGCLIARTEISIQSFNVNIGEKLKINSLVYANFSPANYSWSLFDASGVSVIDSAALTATRISTNSANTFLNIDLVISPNSLRSSSTYTLKLSCSSSGNTEAFSSVLIRTNSLPRGGTFTTSPTKGKALSTLFNLLAQYWISDELPLLYEFGFISNAAKGVFLPLQEKSEAPYAVSILPSLFQNVSSWLNLYVFISDIMNSNSSSYFEVELQPSHILLHELKKNVDNYSQLQSSSRLSILSSQLNSVDCSLAPNCSSLYRAPCSSVQNSCGSCLVGYYGIDSDDNSYCLPVLENRRRLRSDTCDSSSLYSCGPIGVCVKGTCVMQNKTCSLSCSKTGSCVYYNINSGYRVDSCLADDFTCSSKCQCDVGYYGIFCADSASVFASRVALRNILISSFDRSFYLGATDSSTIRNWINLAVSLAFYPSELSLSSFNMLVLSVERILQYAENRNMNSEDLLPLGACFNSFITFCGTLKNTSHVSCLGNVDTLLKAWSDVMSSDLVYSQHISVIQRNFRFKIFTLKLQQNISLQEPQTRNEMIAQSYQAQNILIYAPPLLNHSTYHPNKWVALSLFSYSASTVRTGFNTNPTGFYFNNISSRAVVTTMATFPVQLTLSNHMKVQPKWHKYQQIITTCTKNNFNTHRYECGGGFPNIVVSCPGIAVTFMNQCPDYRYIPRCSTLDSFGNLTMAETDLIGHTNASTMCKIRSLEYLVVRSATYATTTIVSDGRMNQYKQSSSVAIRDDNSSGISAAVITICLGVFVLLALIIRPSSHNLFQKGENPEKKIKWNKKLAEKSFANRIGYGVSKLDIEENRLAMEKLLSPLFLRNDLRNNIILALRLYHSFLGSNIPFVVKLLGGLSSIQSFIFWDILILLLDHDIVDSQCRAMNEISCRSARSIFDSKMDRCRWDTIFQSCSYAPAVNSPMILVVFTVIAQCLYIPVVLSVYWMLNRSFQMHVRKQATTLVSSPKRSKNKKSLVDMMKSVSIENKREFIKRMEPITYLRLSLCASNDAIDSMASSYLKSKIANSHAESPSIIGRQLLQCFLVESLDYVPAVILQRHFDRLFPPPVTAFSSSILFSLVVLINVLVFIVTVVLAVNSPQDTQIMFSKCFICWVVLDVLIVHPIYLIQTFALLPSLAHTSISRLFQSLTSTNANSDTIHTISQLLAANFPKVRESRFVLAAKIEIPGKSHTSKNQKTNSLSLMEFFVSLPQLWQDILAYYLLTGIVVSIFIAVIVMVQYSSAMVVIPLLVIGTTIFYVFYLPRSMSVLADSDSPSLSVYTVDVLDSQAQLLQSKDTFDTTLLSNSASQINILPLELENFPIPVTLADIVEETRQIPSNNRSKNIAASEEYYQAALATGVSTESGRRLLLRSATQAMEAGLIDTAKSRLQKSLYGTLNVNHATVSPPVNHDGTTKLVQVVPNPSNLWSYSPPSEEKTTFENERYQLISRGEFVPLTFSATDLNFDSDSESSRSDSSNNDTESNIYSRMVAVAEYNEKSSLKLSPREEKKFDRAEFNSDCSSRVSEVRSDRIQSQSVVDAVLSNDIINVDFSSTNSDSDSTNSVAYDLYD
eukprot:gene23502-31854_t